MPSLNLIGWSMVNAASSGVVARRCQAALDNDTSMAYIWTRSCMLVGGLESCVTGERRIGVAQLLQARRDWTGGADA